MKSENTQKRKPTWNQVGGLTLLALFLGMLIGIWMISQRLFLVPPLAVGTSDFYIAVGVLPALVTFFITVRARPTGSRFVLVALSIFGCMISIVYFTIIGPGMYTDIQCQATASSGLTSHLDCTCQFESSEGKVPSKCTADTLWPLPFMKLVEERQDVP